MAIELITGHAGTAHISSADAGAYNAGTAGSGRYILPTANELAATMEDANTLTIATGDALFDGRHVRITSAESVTIDSGAQGMMRRDIVGILYQISADIETAELAVYKGSPVASGATDPELPTGNILEGAITAFMPLYRISLDGISPREPELLCDKLSTLSDIGALAARVTANASNIATLSGKHFGGILVNSHRDVAYANNDVWLVTLAGSTELQAVIVWKNNNVGHSVVLIGTPIEGSGKNWRVITAGGVFGIYSESRASVYSATKLN